MRLFIRLYLTREPCSDSSLDEVRVRYDAAKPKLEMLETKKKQLISKTKTKDRAK